MSTETVVAVDNRLREIAEALGVSSVIEFDAESGSWDVPGIAYHRASVGAAPGVRAELAVAARLGEEHFEHALRATFRAGTRFVLLGVDELLAPYQLTDWAALYHRDFVLLERRSDGSGGEFFLFERKPAARHSLPGHLVVSLTSYAARFSTLELTLRSLLQQTVRADEVVLWLAPDDLEKLPTEVIDLERDGLSVRITEDTRSYKKLVPTLQAYPESFILVADDDLVYPMDLISPLVDGYSSPHEILCRRAHQIRYGADQRPLPYLEWRFHIPASAAHPDVFPTTGHGTLYPPGSLHEDVMDAELFSRLAPTADDVWFYWMARRAGSVCRVVGPIWEGVNWPGSQESALMDVNWAGGNDRQIVAMLDHFGWPTSPQVVAQVGTAPAADATKAFDSAAYWTRRYTDGGNSGAGSYGRLAAFKAEILNAFVNQHGLRTVIEFGSGDGAQLTLAEYPSYIGFDVAQPCVDQCRERFAADATKSFRHTDDYAGDMADVTLSLDVIYHLIEDEVFEDYMARLFDAARRYVVVYASNVDQSWPSAHVRHRKFTDWVERHRADFALIEHIPNRYPLVNDEIEQSFADFYIFERRADGVPRRETRDDRAAQEASVCDDAAVERSSDPLAPFVWGNASVERIKLTDQYEPIQPWVFLGAVGVIGARSVLDIGANIGYYSLVSTLASSVTTVVGFEAAPHAAAEFRENVRRNGLEDRIEVLELAVSDKAGEAEFLICTDLSGINALADSTMHERSRYQETSLRVATVSLDEWWASRVLPTGPVAVKVDVEGSEHAVFLGAERLLSEHEVVLQVEMYEDNRERVTAQLEGLGFELLLRCEHDWYWTNSAELIERWNEVVEVAMTNCVRAHMEEWPPALVASATPGQAAEPV